MRLSAELLNSAEQRPNPLGERELVLRGMGIPAVEHMGATRDAYDAIDFTDNRILRLDNFPRLLRLASLMLAGNLLETIDVNNIKSNIPNITSLALDNNRVSTLLEISNIGTACPKLEFLSLIGNPVTRRQHYRLYTIHCIPSLRVLDMVKVKQSEREKAERLAKSAAGAALESDVKAEGKKTFVPGEGRSAEESFSTSFTREQKEQIRQFVANAKTPAEIEQIEDSVQRGIFPSFLPPTVTPPHSGIGENGQLRLADGNEHVALPSKRKREGN